MKAISAIIATIMLLMISVSMVGVFYVFSSGLTTSSTSSASEQASQITKQLSMCMRIDNIYGNQVTLRNCGKGVIENKSLVVMIDDIKLGASTATIAEDSSGTVNVSGLWSVTSGKHNLKISNGAAVAQALVEIKPNPDGLVGSWSFDEGSGNKAVDSSGNGNTGTLINMNTTGNATSGWTTGKFGKGLQFDGSNDYVDAGNGASLNIVNAIMIETWIKFNSKTTHPVLVSRGFQDTEGYYLQVTNSGRVQFITAQSGSQTEIGTATGEIGDNEWYNIVAVKSGSSGAIYVNGVDKTLGSTTLNNPVSSNRNLYIGRYDNGADQVNGTIDDVRIWSKALAPDDTVVMKQII